MSVWQKWKLSTAADGKFGLRPFLIRFVNVWPLRCDTTWLGKPPVKTFPSFWANVACLSDRERDFFVQCVEHICFGIGMSATPAIKDVMNRLADGAGIHNLQGLSTTERESHTDILCDVVLMHDGKPCMGWFADNYGDRNFNNIIEVLEERWNISPASLWALKERNIAEQMNSMTHYNRQESIFCNSDGLTEGKLASLVKRHVRFADKNICIDVKSISEIRSLSLSLLEEPTVEKREILLQCLSNVVPELITKPGKVSPCSTVFKAFGCFLAPSVRKLDIPLDSVYELGSTLCSIPADDVTAHVFQRHIRHLLDITEGKQICAGGPDQQYMLRDTLNNLESVGHDLDQVFVCFSQAVALCQVVEDPTERDDALCRILLAIPLIERYITSYESAILRQHTFSDSCLPSHVEPNHSNREVCLLDSFALDRVICASNCREQGANASADSSSAFDSTKGKPFDGCCGFWMPGTGLDSSCYVTDLLSACTDLANMLGVPASRCDIVTESQRLVYDIRHKLRVHTLRRFAFVKASKVWNSALRKRALPFLNALRSSLYEAPALTILRFRDGERLPNTFGAASEPSSLLQSLSSLHVCFAFSTPAFYVECGTIQELEAMCVTQPLSAMRRLKCFSSPSSNTGISSVVEVPVPSNLVDSLLVCAKAQLQLKPEHGFVDVAFQRDGDHATVVPSCLDKLLRGQKA
ncbi:hypothetical protein DPX39_030060200 [Trypanosoma brucei equiperdum]|uniref:Uncharacterized protein n=1 Tax=Trypanosoma brucei equiperdum TaxID=630700 RepID=A0A3L6LDH2_9TRYP|nr:hypothetical protein DPX39_030055200 [Trypanosoma brucei equiperdum]RHW73611.1 hypothetical protein DPX39_030070200 [Trypanosoma brucei equiperdum]RHW73651.1 hypothetical protein DPX39_030065200 [Trypanosoma brucei equiperdum]RHW73761.1 hypothetical protein DPX39_030060200 [Trypanosoma brucei equiperdum]